MNYFCADFQLPSWMPLKWELLKNMNHLNVNVMTAKLRCLAKWLKKESEDQIQHIFMNSDFVSIPHPTTETHQLIPMHTHAFTDTHPFSLSYKHTHTLSLPVTQTHTLAFLVYFLPSCLYFFLLKVLKVATVSSELRGGKLVRWKSANQMKAKARMV